MAAPKAAGAAAAAPPISATGLKFGLCFSVSLGSEFAAPKFHLHISSSSQPGSDLTAVNVSRPRNTTPGLFSSVVAQCRGILMLCKC